MSAIELTGDNPNIDQTLAAVLARLSEAYRKLLWDYSKKTGLSPIQIQFLVFLTNHSRPECKISRIARNFHLTQATVSDAIKSLEKKRLVARNQSESDGRVSFLYLTSDGESLADSLKGWQTKIIKQIEACYHQDKDQVLLFLMELIEALKNDKVLTVALTCLSCRSFQKNTDLYSVDPYYCAFNGRYLAAADLQMDCPNYNA